MTERMTSLTVFTKESDEEGRAVFALLSDLAGDLGMTHQSAWVSTHKMEDSLDGDDNQEDLYHDENTMVKVYQALTASVERNQYSSHSNKDFVDGLVHALQNAGILFRERRS